MQLTRSCHFLSRLIFLHKLMSFNFMFPVLCARVNNVWYYILCVILYYLFLLFGWGDIFLTRIFHEQRKRKIRWIINLQSRQENMTLFTVKLLIVAQTKQKTSSLNIDPNKHTIRWKQKTEISDSFDLKRKREEKKVFLLSLIWIQILFRQIYPGVYT